MSARPTRPGPPDPRQTHHVAQLLVSVRSGDEARAALAGGADVIDIKEPLRGPLGRAECAVWNDVTDIVRRTVPVSVALGELHEWSADNGLEEIPRSLWSGLAYCKLGLSNAPPDWIDRWRRLRDRLTENQPASPAWVAVVYVDWQAAGAPAPQAVIDEASTIEACRGVLFDTWGKSRCSGITLAWRPYVDRVRNSGRFVALAGSLDAERIRELAPLEPDLFAVRGAACIGGNRLGIVDRRRVSDLATAVQKLGL